jgi:hypothetical protein
MEQTGTYRILVAMETDATRYHGNHAARPAILNQTDAEQMLAHVAADITALLPDTSRCALISAGALFDQTQVLRPSYPVFTTLESLLPSRPDNEGFQPALISIGGANGVLPDPGLQPLLDIPLGLLQLLPIVVHGPVEEMSDLGQKMEHRFLEEGQISAHSASWLESAFGISITHARLMTLTDLKAMFRLQLEHFDFLPLWELLDAAMTGRPDPLEVKTPNGNVLQWRDGKVRIEYETFDHWSRLGGGRHLASDRQLLSEGYAGWTREVRQYLTTLAAHAVEVAFHLPGDTMEVLGETFFVEISSIEPAEDATTVTEHSYAELGTIAITMVSAGSAKNYYPLSPRGLNDIHTTIRDQQPEGHILSIPGNILYDEDLRTLKPDSAGGDKQR